MRYAIALLVLAAAACERQQPKPTARPAPVAFDGAAVTNAAARLSHGERLTWVLGCRGCHGEQLQGKRFYELYASNLTREVPKYSDAQLERLIRHGERMDGRVLWAMPSHLFQHLSDADYAAIVADLRTLKPGGLPTQPALPFTAETKAALARGEIKPEAIEVRDDRAIAPVDLGPQHALGRYITMVTCAECHGPKLEGDPSGKPPNLIVAGGYSRAEFERLLTTGVPTGGRKLDLMASVATNRMSHLTVHERDALYAYLKARSALPQ